MEACNSILLYGSEIWAETLKCKKRANALLAVQRTAALRVTSAYRTVSASAVFIIAAMIPIDLHAAERMKIFNAKQRTDESALIVPDVRSQTIEEWQYRWNEDRNGRWTAKLIPNIEKWISRKHGEVNYYLTQILSGHGYFRKYLHKMRKCSTPFCMYEEKEVVDDAEHTFFFCKRWSDNREELELQIGTVTTDNLIDKMTGHERAWEAVAKYSEIVLRSKKRDLDRAQNTQEHSESEPSNSTSNSGSLDAAE